MRILTHIHAYPPSHNAGAEWMLHSMNKYMVQQGHECHVLTTCSANYEIDGVKVFQDDFDNNNREWRWCDIGLTHLVRSGKAWNWSEETRKPIVYVMHNSFTNRLVEVKQNFKLIYNTEWIKEDCEKRGYNHPNVVLHPPVWFDDYHTESKNRKYITLINCWNKKGGKVLVDLARMNPDREFLGVLGGYGEQIQDTTLKNLRYVDNTPNIKQIYAQTRILIMPSVYESYGRTAVEAMCSGIPVVASATPGLKESLGDCGLFAPEVQEPEQLDYREFEKIIFELDNKTLYNDLSLKSINRAREFDKRNVKEMELLIKSLKKWLN